MSFENKEITVAHSPDSDDAFMFYALTEDKLDTQGLKVNQVLKDIRSLNQDAINGKCRSLGNFFCCLSAGQR